METCWHGPVTYESNNGSHLLASFSSVGSFNDTWVKRTHEPVWLLHSICLKPEAYQYCVVGSHKAMRLSQHGYKNSKDTAKWQEAIILPSQTLWVLTRSLLSDIVTCLLHTGSSGCGCRADPHWLLNSWTTWISLVPPAQWKRTSHCRSLLGVLDHPWHREAHLSISTVLHCLPARIGNTG